MLNARLKDPQNTLVFSAVTLWEIAIKYALKRPDFTADPLAIRPGLLAFGYEELPITGRQVVTVATLPPIHGDPFDRLLLAQAHFEGIKLLTNDRTLASYPGPVEWVE